MLNKKITDLLNDQINKELYSAYLYLDMSTFYLGKHLYGFASWFKKQAAEETEHADKMISYLVQEGAPVELKDVAHAGKSYKDLKEPLAFQLEHEMYVTSLITTSRPKRKRRRPCCSRNSISSPATTAASTSSTPNSASGNQI